jgi:predicted ArsR family transcriptional regulator
VLHHKAEGLTIDALSDHLKISRNAVQQHITSLERDGLIEAKQQRATGGRPSRAYTLSEKGYEAFPRNYDLLAQTMLETAHHTLGEAAVEALLTQMADELAKDLQPRLQALPASERLGAVLEVMNKLGYQAQATADEAGIAAVNCVYHKLAKQTRAICRYDVKLLSLLLERPIAHTSCMADGNNQCIFKIKAPSSE